MGGERFYLRFTRWLPSKLCRAVKEILFYLLIIFVAKQLGQYLMTLSEGPWNDLSWLQSSSDASQSNRRISATNSMGQLYRQFRNSSGVFTLANADLAQARRIYWRTSKSYVPSFCGNKVQNPKHANFSAMEKNALKEISRFSSNKFLRKTVFESKPKVILFVGLEGTGHHFVRKAFKLFYGPKANFSSGRFLTYSSLMKCGSHQQVFSNSSNLNRLRKDLLDYKFRVLLLNSVEGAFFLSYPNCGGGNRAANMPDARHLAELCEQLGLDFQIILLSRNPESILISTVVHRRFGPNFGFQSELYFYVLRIIESQLELLDQRFVAACINIESNNKQFEFGLSGLKKTIGANETLIRQLRQDRSPRHYKCLDPKDDKLRQDFTKEIVRFYKEAIVLQRICEHVPKIWSDGNLKNS